ncbi:dipeptidase [Alkaliphilus serpentinus]|uniref:Membrane dipeptidase n=1 Tax=Alkaliphilus serpentinus TaxID=1482731 RepID=A0A833HMD2_9FIRM|nr:dipeptidase [Alkaliphilus serpentinus]KAB3527359.1 membrane dipeptidase [Alkaliphilus serpentinus]
MKIIDLHCDTIERLYSSKATSLRNNSFHIDVKKLKRGNSLAQFFAVFLHLEEIRKKGKGPLQVALEMMDLFHAEVQKNSENLAFAGSFEDITKNQENNKISAILTIEEGAVLEGNLDNLKLLYDKGVRLITLTWNYPNEIGFPHWDEAFKDKGLTPFGIEVVEEMNRLGILIDVSHLSDGGFYNVAKVTKKPFIASHSNAREATPHSRNLTDDMIRILAEKGGVMGINFCGNFLNRDVHDGNSRVEDMVRHIQHIHKVGGIDVIALGSDFDGINSIMEIKDFGEIGLLVKALERKGFNINQLEKICHGNALRVIKDVL